VELDPDATDASRATAWWDYAAAAPEADRGPARGRARFWYGKVWAELPDGKDRAVAEDRLALTLNGVAYRPGLVAEVAVGGRRQKGRIDPTVDLRTQAFAPAKQRVPVPVPVQVKWTGVLVPPAAGRYRLIADTTDAVKVALGPRGAEREVIDSKGGLRPEAVVPLPDGPRPVTIWYSAPAGPDHRFALKWVRPGAREAEPVPAAALYHRKADEGLLK
jgi:hypothetical protein